MIFERNEKQDCESRDGMSDFWKFENLVNLIKDFFKFFKTLNLYNFF